MEATQQTKGKPRDKRKAYYRKCAGEHQRHDSTGLSGSGVSKRASGIPKDLKPGLVGYLVTCNFQERPAQMECFRLLNDSLARLGGQRESSAGEKPSELTQLGHTEQDCDDDDDIQSQLLRENVSGSDNCDGKGSLSGLRFSFYHVRTGVKNCLFIAHYASSVTPAGVVHSLFDHLLTTGKAESRHVMRLLPVAATCRSDAEDVRRCVQKVWSEFIGIPFDQNKKVNDSTVNSPSKCATDSTPEIEEPSVHLCQVAGSETLQHTKPTYQVTFKSRNYDRLSRQEAIYAASMAVEGVKSTWNYSPTSPDVIIAINVLRNVTCVSLLEKYDTYRKYNVAELLPSELPIDKPDCHEQIIE